MRHCAQMVEVPRSSFFLGRHIFKHAALSMRTGCQHRKRTPLAENDGHVKVLLALPLVLRVSSPVCRPFPCVEC